MLVPQGHFRVGAVDLKNPSISAAWLDLLDDYARDPMGGGSGLSAYAKRHLVEQLKDLPTFYGALAFQGEAAIGLINGFTGFSTFAAQPLLNIHDVFVAPDVRRQGVARALLRWAEAQARQLGCCKLTLEVLANNHPAMQSYEQAGFTPYQLDPAAGQALLLQKIIEEV